MESRPYGLIGVDDFVRITLPFFRADKKLFYERLEHSVATLDRGGGGANRTIFRRLSIHTCRARNVKKQLANMGTLTKIVTFLESFTMRKSEISLLLTTFFDFSLEVWERRSHAFP